MNRVDRSSCLAAVVFASGAACSGPYHYGSSDSNDAGSVVDSGSGADAGTSGVDSGSGGCLATCSTGCCTAGGSCVPSTAQDWTNCGSPGTACMTCNKGTLCSSGSCDNAHWAPNTMLTITVTSIYGDSCAASFHTPQPYGEFVFDDASPVRTADTGVCAETTNVCEPPSNQIQHVLASWLTDGKTTVGVRDDSSDASPVGFECWGPGVWAMSPPLPVLTTYTETVTGYSVPGMTFALSAE